MQLILMKILNISPCLKLLLNLRLLIMRKIVLTLRSQNCLNNQLRSLKKIMRMKLKKKPKLEFHLLLLIMGFRCQPSPQELGNLIKVLLSMRLKKQYNLDGITLTPLMITVEMAECLNSILAKKALFSQLSAKHSESLGFKEMKSLLLPKFLHVVFKE